jgi:hypothetical protein
MLLFLFRYCWCAAIAAATLPALGSSPQKALQERLDGITPGITLRGALQSFPSLRAEGQGDAYGEAWTARVGGCELVLGSGVPMKDSSRVEVVTLTRSKNTPLGDCSRLRTSRGLTVTTPLADIIRLYPELRRSEAERWIAFTIDDGPECVSGRSDVLRSFRIIWSKRDAAIETIAIDASKSACRDFKAGQSQPDPEK